MKKEDIFKRIFREEHLLQLMCQAHMNPDDFERNKTALSLSHWRVNWEKLVKLTWINNLQTIVLEVLKFHSLMKYLPLNHQKKLIRMDIFTRLYHASHLKKSQIILKNMLKRNINFVVMKTYSLNQELFEGTSIKIPLDLDLMIPIREFKKSSIILLESNYEYLPNHKSKKGSRYISNLDFYAPRSQEIFKKGKHTIELHATITDTPGFSIGPVITDSSNQSITQKLFSGTRKVSFQKIKVKVFKPNQLLISLFLHSFIQHNLQSGISFYEFAKVIQVYKKDLDWSYVDEFMEKYGLIPYFNWFLYLFNDLYPHILPDTVVKRLSEYERSLKPQHLLLFLYMKYKIFHPTNFARAHSKEIQKELCWAVMDNRFLKLGLQKAKNRIIK